MSRKLTIAIAVIFTVVSSAGTAAVNLTWKHHDSIAENETALIEAVVEEQAEPNRANTSSPWETITAAKILEFLPTAEASEPEPEPEPQPVEETPATVETPAPAPQPTPAPAPEPQPAPAPAPKPAVAANFHPTGACETECFYDGTAQSIVDNNKESTLCIHVQYVADGCYIAGHNFNGMGDKVLSLSVGDKVVVHSGAMAGTYKVSGIRHYAYNASPAEVGFSTGFALSTCLWDNSAMRMVDLVKS